MLNISKSFRYKTSQLKQSILYIGFLIFTTSAFLKIRGNRRVNMTDSRDKLAMFFITADC